MNSPIVRWNPFKERDHLPQPFASTWGLDPLLRIPEEPFTVAQWTPRVDVTENDEEFLIKAELPEMKKENVRITLEDGTLTITGERTLEHEEKKKTYHRIEREYGSFVRSFRLPTEAAADKAAAEFKDGVLRVHLPKNAHSSSAKAIKIRAT